VTTCSRTPTSFVGCDVGKTSIVVFDTRSGRTRTVANHPEPLAGLAAELDETCLVVCEATGGYEAALLDALHQAGRTAHRADARKVKAFIRSFGTLGKSDAIDARALARYGQERHRQLPRWSPRDETRALLQALVLTRRDLIAARTAWSNRRKAPGGALIDPLVAPLCQRIDEQIAAVDAEIARLLASHQPLRRDLAVLRTITGLGHVCAAALLALMPELGTMKRRQAAALAGLAPHPNQSGERNGYRPVRGGRPEVKRLLFMAALSASRHNPQIKSFYQRLIANGKKPIVALTAVMRKLVTIANARLGQAHDN
jgi:transposase